MPDLVPIPQPPPHLFGLLGNIPELEETPAQPVVSDTLIRLAGIYGPIFKLVVPTRTTKVIISSQKLALEVYNEDRFEKFIDSALLELRPFIKDGLFTSYPDEPVSRDLLLQVLS